MKTKEEILDNESSCLESLHTGRNPFEEGTFVRTAALISMQKFADQEKAALKDRITHEATVDSIIWEVLQIDRMSNQEFDSERERRHLQIRKVQEILKSI